MNYINNNTTVGKTVNVGLWLVVANALLALLTVLLGHPELFDPKVLAALSVINVVLVAFKNLLDPNVRNF